MKRASSRAKPLTILTVNELCVILGKHFKKNAFIESVEVRNGQYYAELSVKIGGEMYIYCILEKFKK